MTPPPAEWLSGYHIGIGPGGFAWAEPEPRPPCALCGGVGLREVVIGGRTRAGRCRCQRILDRLKLWNGAGVPGRHAASTMDSYRSDLDGARPGWMLARAWLDRFEPGARRGLVFTGAPGRGKTHLACAIVRELVFRHGVACQFVEFTHLLSQLREGFERGDGDGARMTELARVPVLVLDELGKGRGTEWERSVLDELVTRRYDNGGLLVATTNYATRTASALALERRTLAAPTVESLEDRVGERVYSRLRETVDFVPVLGDDHRGDRQALERTA